MRSQFFIIFGVIIALYFTAGYYSGLNILRFFNRFIAPGFQTFVFWLLWVAMAVLPFSGRFVNGYFSGRLDDWLTLTGYYWLTAIYYLTLILLVFNGFFYIERKISLFGEIVKANQQFTASSGVFILVLTGLILAYGTYNSQNPIVRHYDLTIPKNAGGISSVRAVLVTDTHLGFIVDNRQLKQMVNMVNELNPDLVFMAGDIIEENANYFNENKMAIELKRLNPRLGVYAVLGNHEYLGGKVEEIIKSLNEAGVTVIRDEYVKIEESFYIVGRDDISLARFTGKQRLELAEVMKGIDRSLPVILLDHQPFSLDEARKQQVDLELSGHTHRGQFFPNNLITGLLFENDYGHLNQNGFQSIVSSGFGTWGPPVRIGNSPEIVNINIQFVH